MGTRVLLGALFLAWTCPAAAKPALAVTVPAAWAGIWAVTDTTYSGNVVLSTSTWLDTLCTGEELDTSIRTDYFGVYDAACTGTGFTDTGLSLDCSVYLPSCTIGYNGCFFGSTWRWVRNGDEATTYYDYRWQFAIDVHHPVFGSQRTTGIRTRIAGVDGACGTVPVLRKSWGTLKLSYR